MFPRNIISLVIYLYQWMCFFFLSRIECCSGSVECNHSYLLHSLYNSLCACSAFLLGMFTVGLFLLSFSWKKLFNRSLLCLCCLAAMGWTWKGRPTSRWSIWSGQGSGSWCWRCCRCRRPRQTALRRLTRAQRRVAMTTAISRLCPSPYPPTST